MSGVQLLVIRYLLNVKNRTHHSSEIKGLCLMKYRSESLQNLPYFYLIRKPTYLFSFFISCNFIFSLMAYVNIDQGIHLGAKIVKNNMWAFLMIKIWQILKDFAMAFHQA